MKKSRQKGWIKQDAKPAKRKRRSRGERLEFLQGAHLFPNKPDSQSVACFLRYTAELDKNSIDTALRVFLETFRLPGESQKIHRVLEQSPDILANKDVALLLSYSIILLNTDHHNVQIYHSIRKSEIRTTLEPGFGFLEMTPIAAKISAHYRLENLLDGLLVCICKFITILDPLSVEDSVLALEDDTKVRIATETVFTIANRYGDYIRTGWRSILDCILIFYKLGLLPPRLASDAADDTIQSTVIPCALLDALVANAYYEQITREVGCLVKATASHIRSQSGWWTITALLSITSRHLESSEAGFDALLFIMSDGAHLLPANYILCVDAKRQFCQVSCGTGSGKDVAGYWGDVV
ncbi:ARF guanine-nucleotide exchange factor GNOM Pattern formation protein [Vigna angularis]|uniref:ARF guanine-nucleotide exchange factor GNOM Pattern formation protein n=1 Tax=Phaseolus angularis TaxID=3914 RepID=A0A8T0K4Z0_PHAAN|nr:ARF guanine-nucleotide exchange factor GNOM Pattern formation protein [Vigna angularis]